MTDHPNLKPEDCALIERIMGAPLQQYGADDVTGISMGQLAAIIQAARDEGRRAPGDLEAAARRLLACCEQPRGGLSRQGGEERAAMDGLRAILERRAPSDGTQVGRDEAALPEAVGEAGAMPGSNGGFTMATFKASDVPEGTKLYAAPPPPVTEVAGDDRVPSEAEEGR